ncbi:ATP-grasp domain-containing protein [Pseudomonas sp. PLMAX]|uniref:ATP-grasp domain-containing protein n=1 Tax=Pseudomonas sp. PLMAX TaxID=2201998 RepID=UPI0038BCFD37
MKLKVWFNHDYSAVASEIQALLQHEATLRPEDRIIGELHTAHCDQDLAGSSAIHRYAKEPENVTPDRYLRWALVYANAHGINFLVLGRHHSLLARHVDDFRAIGVELLFACSAKELAIVDVKSDFYHRLEQAFYADMVPYWKIWNGEYRTTFDQTIKSALRRGRGQFKVCVKPASRLMGQNFFTFQDPEQRHDSQTPVTWSIQQTQTGAKKDWMVMEYLAGPEYEVDCLAWKGQLRNHKVEMKCGGHAPERLQHSAELIRQLQVLAREFGLSGLFRATFRQDRHGRFKVLGVNPRITKGTPARAGDRVNLIWEWLKFAELADITSTAYLAPAFTATQKRREPEAPRKGKITTMPLDIMLRERSYATC